MASASLSLNMSNPSKTTFIAQPIIRLRACASSCVYGTPDTKRWHLCQLTFVICVLAAVSTYRPATHAWNYIIQYCCRRLDSSARLPHSQSWCHLRGNAKKRQSLRVIKPTVSPPTLRLLSPQRSHFRPEASCMHTQFGFFIMWNHPRLRLKPKDEQLINNSSRQLGQFQ